MGLTFRGPLEPRSWTSYRAQPSGTTTLNRIGKPGRIPHGRGVVGYASELQYRALRSEAYYLTWSIRAI